MQASVVAACGLSSCGVRALGHAGFSSCGVWAQELWLTGLVAPWHVGSSQTRDQPVSPALAGRFLTTAPQGKLLVFSVCLSRSCNVDFIFYFLIFC